MLKHCHNSSIRLQRKCNPETSSLNSTLTVPSSCGSSDSNRSENSLINCSFNINSGGGSPDQFLPHMMCNRAVFAGTPEPISLSSRASSFSSLSDSGPRIPIKVFASCLRPDIEYKTIGVSVNTTAKELIWQLLAKYKMRHRDPKLFYLTMEVAVQKTGGNGVSRRTIIVEDDSRPAELKNCNPWGECKFTLVMRKGGLVRIYDSVLMEESNYKSLLISEETTVEDVVKILLHCYGLERLERVDRFVMYEQCSDQRYQRKLNNDDKPLCVQGQWPGPGMFSFVLRRSIVSVEDNHWASRPNIESVVHKPDNEMSWSMLGNNRTENHSPWTLQEEVRHSNNSVYERVWSKDNKTSDEHVSSDMDTSISSNDSPTPPSTSTPLSSVSSSSSSPPVSPCSKTILPSSSSGADRGLPKPLPSFLFPSPDYASFPAPLISSTPYSAKPSSISTPHSVSSLSSTSSSLSLSSFEMTVVPMLPPKPASLASLFSRPPSNNSYSDYENYFYI